MFPWRSHEGSAALTAQGGRLGGPARLTVDQNNLLRSRSDTAGPSGIMMLGCRVDGHRLPRHCDHPKTATRDKFGRKRVSPLKSALSSHESEKRRELVARFSGLLCRVFATSR